MRRPIGYCHNYKAIQVKFRRNLELSSYIICLSRDLIKGVVLLTLIGLPKWWEITLAQHTKFSANKELVENNIPSITNYFQILMEKLQGSV
jgi:hypothetical protein